MGSYERSAIAYDALHEIRGLDYAAGADRVTELVRQRSQHAATLLDVACGTGRHLERFRETFEVEGLDRSNNMATFAQDRLPDVPVHLGDMRDFVRAESGVFEDLAVARISRSWAEGTLTTLEMHWTLGTTDEIHSFVERHELRLYEIDRYAQAFDSTGLEVDHDQIGLIGRGLFVGTPG